MNNIECYHAGRDENGMAWSKTTAKHLKQLPSATMVLPYDKFIEQMNLATMGES